MTGKLQQHGTCSVSRQSYARQPAYQYRSPLSGSPKVNERPQMQARYGISHHPKVLDFAPQPLRENSNREHNKNSRDGLRLLAAFWGPPIRFAHWPSAFSTPSSLVIGECRC